MERKHNEETLRIYADFNSVMGDGGDKGLWICWYLCHGEPRRPLDESADELGLQDGMPAILYMDGDPAEMLEVPATLFRSDSASRWVARYDPEGIRVIPIESPSG